MTLFTRDYDLAATLSGGQAFRWRERDGGWEGVVRGHWLRLGLSTPAGGPEPDAQGGCRLASSRETPIAVTTADERAGAPPWLADYLGLDDDLSAVTATFPDDSALRRAVRACWGLRLLRQEPWECLASFLLSSNKQIVQIRQIVATLAARFGQPVRVARGHPPEFAFPTADRLAACTETELRACQMGFRARYLLATAQALAAGRLDLERLRDWPLDDARRRLMELPGVGRKIADCVLLFSLGFRQAFPVDVWVLKALRRLYFANRCPAPRELIRFTETHFGPFAGYAQQYLFHHARITQLD